MTASRASTGTARPSVLSRQGHRHDGGWPTASRNGTAGTGGEGRDFFIFFVVVVARGRKDERGGVGGTGRRGLLLLVVVVVVVVIVVIVVVGLLGGGGGGSFLDSQGLRSIVIVAPCLRSWMTEMRLTLSPGT
jgi:hypothetical protein